MPGETKKYPTCTECGCGEFVIHGLVQYHESYNSPLDEYGDITVEWEGCYPYKARCRQCDCDATELFREYDHAPFLVSVPRLE